MPSSPPPGHSRMTRWFERARGLLDLGRGSAFVVPFGRVLGRRLHLGLAAVLAIAIYAGLAGIDFGYHWDEPWMMQIVGEAVKRGELLPRF
jgi:hypothetical protein